MSLVTVESWSSFFTGDEIRIQTSETDLSSLFFFFFVPATVWADPVHEEHHEGPGSLRRCFPVVSGSSTQKSPGGGGAPEQDRKDDPEPEGGVCLHVCMSERVREEEWSFKTGNEKTSWEITCWCSLTKASSLSTDLLPIRGRGGLLLLKGNVVLVFSLFWEEWRGSGGGVSSLKALLWFPPGGRCQGVGRWHLQQQTGDVQDDEGLLHPDHHHQQGRGLHLLRRAQEMMDAPVLTTFPDRPRPSLSNQV